MYDLDQAMAFRVEALNRGLALRIHSISEDNAATIALLRWGVGQFVLDLNQGEIVLVNPTPERVASFIRLAYEFGGWSGEVLAILALEMVPDGGPKYRWNRPLSPVHTRPTLGDWLSENGQPIEQVLPALTYKTNIT